jgi:hypothetical protein
MPFGKRTFLRGSACAVPADKLPGAAAALKVDNIPQPAARAPAAANRA